MNAFETSKAVIEWANTIAQDSPFRFIAKDKEQQDLSDRVLRLWCVEFGSVAASMDPSSLKRQIKWANLRRHCGKQLSESDHAVWKAGREEQFKRQMPIDGSHEAARFHNTVLLMGLIECSLVDSTIKECDYPAVAEQLLTFFLAQWADLAMEAIHNCSLFALDLE